MTKQKIVIVYFQHDLRIEDQPSLFAALKTNIPVVGVYLLPPQKQAMTTWGFKKTGPFRLQFLIESLLDLKNQLATLNVPLLVYLSDPLSAGNQIHNHYHVEHVYACVEPGSEEINLRQTFIAAVGNPPLTLTHDKPLLDPDDYPWLLSHLPNRFTDARMQIEMAIKIRPLLPSPTKQSVIAPILDDWQALQKMYLPKPQLFKGGETSAKQHLNHYFFGNKKILTYKQTRNNMLAFEDSSKLSPALSLGLLSPRWIYWELKKVEATFGKNDSTYWLWFELLWRDYFYFLHLKFANQFFSLSGLMGMTKSWENHPPYFEAILKAQTGYPLVDANLKELFTTGWMSNRGRQNVASFISKILNLDWRFGASLFEHYLIDYDVSSNYGNWQYLSGVGVDPREERIFNVSLQAKKYDPNGAYIKHWLPALNLIPVPLIYQPWRMNPLEMALYQCQIGQDYPAPIVDDSRVQLK
jgi:deoxyribodipyrimidine photo-lyase